MTYNLVSHVQGGLAGMLWALSNVVNDPTG